LREFISYTKISSSDNLKNIASVSHVVAAREPGQQKSLQEVGGNIQKGSFMKKSSNRGGN
jgi:hypothetical protein